MVSLRPTLIPRIAPACSIGFLSMLMIPRKGAVALSITLMVTRQAFPASPRTAPVMVPTTAETLSIASSATWNLVRFILSSRSLACWTTLSKALTFLVALLAPGSVWSSTTTGISIR